MAEARLKTERPGVILELSAEEADTLFLMMHYVSGDPKRSPRRHTQDVLDALKATGRQFGSPEYRAVSTHLERGSRITFYGPDFYARFRS